MSNIPTDLLRTFVTTKDLGGFTSAGELLGRSQPAISLQIKKLVFSAVKEARLT